ncbi:NAD/NADP octopine/nopaline dehydrogenase family protein [Paraburkholderia sediminicola]|uniref:NAD/NADP octopine/nopaline dehydrogenase family protein n=1 Tax=Paraburkholderia sediminicola TaxID=458836 RepID=UPI0038BAABBD
MDKIVIVGGGHVGLTLAVDLRQRRNETEFDPHIVLLRGNDHPFFRRDDSQKISLENIISGEQVTDVFPAGNVHAISEDATELLRECRLVIVTVPDILPLRDQVFEWIKENSNGQQLNLVFVRGGQGGLIPLLARHRSGQVLHHASLVLVEDSFYGTRYISDKVEFKRKKKTNVALAGPNAEKALALLRRAFTGPTVGKDWHHFNVVRALDLQFDPLGYIIHLGVALDEKNLEKTKRGYQYLHYCEGVHAGNAERLRELDKERVALAAQYGAKTRLFTAMLEEQYGLKVRQSFLETMQDTKSIYRSRSAESMADLKTGRVLQEDIPALLTIDWLTEKAEIDLPATRAHTENIIRKIGSLGLDIESFSGYKRQLEKLDLSKADVVRLLMA